MKVDHIISECQQPLRKTRFAYDVRYEGYDVMIPSEYRAIKLTEYGEQMALLT